MCNIKDDCELIEDLSREELNTSLAFMGENALMTINNTTFNNIYGNRGLTITDNGKIEIYNSTFSNCHFDNGLIEVDTKNKITGNYQIENSFFYNNTSEYGSIVNIKSFDDDMNGKIKFINSKFENNSVSNFGGVIYSNSLKTNKYVSFNNCEFMNNKAENGNISFSLSKDSEPIFSNIESLRKTKGLITTNPTKILLNDNYDIKLFSGEKLPYGIACK
ncbi:hypothetical protein PIROE2DRAFT_63400 [Piromyces sp. E2]|nr:hypothetical protein PIROE2DRAFT_63400 [Piromyces sp. E2]|eukprot:OUM60024.1 hypothetical protein PIROE2DRAFT_63400 [Piromyces sp. E2]